MCSDYLTSQIQAQLSKECFLDFTRIVLVGVSGGADSLCLMHALHQAGYPVLVAHLNHQLRPEAESDAIHVANLAAGLGLPFVSQSIDVHSYAVESALSIEEAARMLRYRFLFEQAGLHHAQAVLVGHTADDQAETILMHFLRGSGLSGLKGMLPRWLPNAWSKQIPLVRPLLNLWREDTVRYCQEHGLSFVQDASNQDTAYHRNHLRSVVIPYLEQINPELRPALWRMAQTLQSDAAIVEQAVEAAWRRCVLVQQSGAVAFNLARLLEEPLGIQRQLLRRSLSLAQPGLRNIDFAHVQRALQCLADPPASRQCNLVAGMRLLFEAGRVWVAAWEAELPTGDWPQITETLSWGLPCELDLSGGWVLKAENLPFTTELSLQAQENADPYQAFLDIDCLSSPLLVRHRQAGDRFQPLGMPTGTIKIKDYFINQKLPRRARAGWPLVCAAGLIVWVPGFGLAHTFRLTSATRQVAWLRLSRR